MWPVSSSYLLVANYLIGICPSERESFRDGPRTTISGHDNSVKVRNPACHASRLSVNLSYIRDPTKHNTLKEEIEEQSTALYASARLWDDGIIKPVDTRDTVGLALALAARERGGTSLSRKSLTTWDGDGKGFGVFRM